MMGWTVCKPKLGPWQGHKLCCHASFWFFDHTGTVSGTEALKAVDAMRQLGFTSTMKQTCAMEDLRQQLQGGHWPIVFVNTLPITGQRNAHAVVVVEVGSAQLTVYDPLDGERVLPQAPFLTAWAMMHNLALLIQR